MLPSNRWAPAMLSLLWLNGCNTEPPKPTIDECFSQLKQGMTTEEIVTLMGEPHQRTDGPQVAVSDTDPVRGRSIVLDKRVIFPEDPVSMEMLRFYLFNSGQRCSEPLGFGTGPAVQFDPASPPVLWLYRPSQGRRKKVTGPDKSLISLGFREGKLVDAYRLSQ